MLTRKDIEREIGNAQDLFEQGDYVNAVDILLTVLARIDEPNQDNVLSSIESFQHEVEDKI